MDAPDLDRARHVRALEALARINRVSRTAARLWSEIAALAREGLRPVRVLDVACGGGDVLHDVARRAAQRGIEIELAGCDVSPVALEHAGRRPWPAGPPRLDVHDAVRNPLPGRHDVVCSSLFLHHLAPDGAAAALRGMAEATTRVLLVQDLRRTALGYALAWIGLHTLTRSDVARADGLVSVAAAFTIPEARAVAAAAGLHDAEVRPCWPQRFTLRWRRA